MCKVHGLARLKNRWLFALTAGFLLFVAGCSQSDQAAGEKPPQMPPTPVTAVAVKQKDVPLQLHAIGSVHPYSTVSIKSRVDGQLAKVGFKEGDEVKEGDLIFTIDPRPFETALHEVEANLARDTASLQNAEADMRRTDELATTKAVAATVVDQNRAKVASLKGTVAADQAAVESATVQLSFCYIHAPITGRIGVLLVNAGNMVKNNDTILATINQIQPTYVDFSVPEQDLPAVRDRMSSDPMTVQVTISRQPGRHAQGELKLINNQVDQATGTVLLRAEFPNRDEWLWPGQFVDAALTLQVETNVVVVPAEAIQFSQQGRYLVVVKPDQTVEFRPVEIGDSLSGEAVVKKGVQPGELVVTSGQLRLQPGSKVQVKNEPL